MKFPYLAESTFAWKGTRPKLFMRVFSPTQDGLACLGFTEGDGAAYELFDNMGDMIARAALAAELDPAEYARLRAWFGGPDVDLSGGSNYIESDRHSVYVNLHAWEKAQKAIRKKFGWPEINATTFERLRAKTSL